MAACSAAVRSIDFLSQRLSSAASEEVVVAAATCSFSAALPARGCLPRQMRYNLPALSSFVSRLLARSQVSLASAPASAQRWEPAGDDLTSMGMWRFLVRPSVIVPRVCARHSSGKQEMTRGAGGLQGSTDGAHMRATTHDTRVSRFRLSFAAPQCLGNITGGGHLHISPHGPRTLESVDFNWLGNKPPEWRS